MSKIAKSKGIVLKKVNYSDSSLIITIFTEHFGKTSYIAKGVRNKRNKSSNKIDILNHVEIVFYKKENRDLQVITEVDLLDYYAQIREDLDALKYSSAILELVFLLVLEDEIQHKVYTGLVRILKLINEDVKGSAIYFLKFFIFLLKEVGYEIQFDKCCNCDKQIHINESVNFNYEKGFVCQSCSGNSIISYEFDEELFRKFYCLSTRKNDIKLGGTDIKKLIEFLEKYISYHIGDYAGLKSLRVY